jgi:hypothetical protein
MRARGLAIVAAVLRLRRRGRPLTMSDGIGLAEALLGLPGFRVLEAPDR